MNYNLKKILILAVTSVAILISVSILFHVLFWEVQEHYVYMMLPFLLATGAILTSKIFSPKNSVLLLDKERSFNA